jgi:hypothetical protein
VGHNTRVVMTRHQIKYYKKKGEKTIGTCKKRGGKQPRISVLHHISVLLESSGICYCTLGKPGDSDLRSEYSLTCTLSRVRGRSYEPRLVTTQPPGPGSAIEKKKTSLDGERPNKSVKLIRSPCHHPVASRPSQPAHRRSCSDVTSGSRACHHVGHGWHILWLPVKSSDPTGGRGPLPKAGMLARADSRGVC